MNQISLGADRERAISALAGKYLWWPAFSPGGHGPLRQVAQVMNLGTYDDIRGLEGILTPTELADVMRRAQPGWFDARSWSLWRGRLNAAGEGVIPENPPVRTFVLA
jgi:hypothetical protein